MPSVAMESAVKSGEDPKGDSEEDSADTWSEERFTECLQTVLGRYYYRSAHRLQMKMVPPCYRDLEKCSREHWKTQNIVVASHALETDCRNQKDDTLFQTINHICIRGYFPGPNILQVILQAILNAEEALGQLEFASDPPQHSLHMSIQSFEMILMQFPPCILQLEPHYSTLLTKQCTFDEMQEFASGADGILCCIVGTIDKVLKKPESEEVSPLEQSNTERDLKNIDITDLGGGFGCLSRNAKLERLHVILHLLVKLMEMDLAMWMLRHPKKASKSMLKPTKQPLVGKILWPNGDFAITPFMDTCFTVFVRSIAQQLPEDLLQISGRLIGLISNAVNLCEVQTTSQVQYPCIKQNSISLAQTFMKSIADFENSSSNLTVNVIKKIPCPISKMLMIDSIFSSIGSHPGSLCITKILKIVREKAWIARNAEISQVEHVNLFADAMKCWLDVYRLHDVFEAYAREEKDEEADSKEQEKMSLDEKVAEEEKRVGRKVRMDYDKLNRDLSKILKGFKRDIPIKYNELNLDCNVLGIADIHQLYIDEFKSVLKLHKFLVNRSARYPKIFADWIALIEKLFGFAIATN
ncbi:uncharacterized protein LOC132260742 [Phlebotomus argentipes]|uniref:uncharacterized protein LOC132260742 n=1 Tax=Phlebotomus argentipes TaxID=94469 RepID=UPI0028932E9C|nr:uncharacterized protein LOC132260742 [Phlebotomus argentipes]